MHKKTTLKNGLTLITAPLKQTQAVTVLVLIPVGSRHETKNINGVSHFVEHLMFKGTEKRPTSLDISKELDSVGAEFNAFTGKDQTGYYIKAASNNIELAFDMLSDMLFNSAFDKTEIDRERGVIVEEINMYEDNPLMHVENMFEEAVFANDPLGWQISGPRSVIKNITRNQLVGYHKAHYHPANMIVIVAGKFNDKKVKDLSRKYFSQTGKAKKKTTTKKFSGKQTSPRIKMMHKPTEQVQLCLGFPANGIKSPNIYAQTLLAVIMGGNMSSRLFTIVREKHGLAYAIHAGSATYGDTGAFLVQAGVDKKRVEKSIKLIMDELKRVAKEGVTDKELQDAKEFLRGKMVLALEDSEHLADWLGKQQLLLDKITTPEQRLKKIFAVTQTQVKKVAQEIVQAQRANLAVIGPFKNPAKFKKLLK